jgi:hypothetical protein
LVTGDLDTPSAIASGYSITENTSQRRIYMELPTHAQAVIIGGGVGGASIAYHLTKWAGRISSSSNGMN